MIRRAHSYVIAAAIWGIPGISIPMMEKRQITNKAGYAAYRKNVRMLI